MSATEVIEQIKQLSAEDQQKVAAFLDDLKATGSSANSNDKVDESFKRVTDEIFTTNAELFRKLAQ
jgi:hypothetical protein